MNAASDTAAAIRTVFADPARRDGPGLRALRLAGTAWLGTALLGQLLFAAYVAGFYGRAALAGRPDRWNEVLPHGYVPGATGFNAVLAMHLLFAVTIIAGGTLQLLPQLRRRAAAFHRWNGRAYVAAAAVLAIGGLALVWIRGGAPGDLAQHVAITGNAMLVCGFALLAWRKARARDIGAHRRWALRLFLVVSGVWFFRIGLMFWILVNGGPAGFDPETFTGPALTFLAFAQYLLPLLVLELYLRAQRCASTAHQLAVAALVASLALPTLVGTAAAAAFMWWPQV